MPQNFYCNNNYKVYEGESWKNEYLPLAGFYGPIYPEAQLSGYHYLDNFIYKGKIHRINSVVKLSKEAQNFLGIYQPYTQVIQHEFTKTNQERWGYLRMVGDKDFKVFTTVPPDQLCEEVAISAEYVEKNYKPQYYSDCEIEGMGFLWTVYLVAMLIMPVFNEFIIGWIGVSIWFFYTRKEKLIKPPQHDYRYKNSQPLHFKYKI